MSAPPNDDLANAIPIGMGTTAGVSVNAVTDHPAVGDNGPKFVYVETAISGTAIEGQGIQTLTHVYSDVWYSYTPATTGTTRIVTEGSDFDTMLIVYRLTDPTLPPSSNNLTHVVGNDEDLSGANIHDSTVQFNGVANTQYFIQAGGFGGEFGNLVVNIDGPAVVCYCTGTRIRTVTGDVPIEALRIGDRVVTASGQPRPIKWIGHRAYAGRFANANPEALLPVCFKVGSLAEGVPVRDLWVSPKHAMFLDGVLIPAQHLVNGISIVKAQRVESLGYWHIELDSHDVLIAEGAESESFVDDDGRGIFHNAHEFRALYPDESRKEAVYYASRVEDGYVLEAVRRRLAERAGLLVPVAERLGTLRGAVEGYDRASVWGWAQNEAYPDAPVCLDVLVDGAVVTLTYAECFRPDLAAEGIGDGCHAFSARFPMPLTSEEAPVIEVRRSTDGVALADAREIERQKTAA